MKDSYIKLFIGMVLFLAWMYFVIEKTPDAEDIISAIKWALIGLGAYHLNNTPAPPSKSDNEPKQ